MMTFYSSFRLNVCFLPPPSATALRLFSVGNPKEPFWLLQRIGRDEKRRSTPSSSFLNGTQNYSVSCLISVPSRFRKQSIVGFETNAYESVGVHSGKRLPRKTEATAYGRS